MSFSDDQLRDYLMGQAAPELAARIEAAVEDDRDLEARLMALDPLAAPVQAAFADLPGPERLARFEAALPAEPHRPVMAWPAVLAAGIAVAAVLGFGAATIWPRPAALDWQERVAIYQALYVPETVAAIEVSENGLARQFAEAGAALTRPLDPQAAGEVPGLALKRAQILAHEGAPIIQIAFAAADGTPVAFCIIRSDSAGRTADPEYTELAGLPVAHWAGGGFGYMLIGEMDKAALQAAARHLHAAFPPV